VLIGPENEDGQHRWYFSLNNRRLWVLKRCREEGLLQSTKNHILVRGRQPKSQSEKERYTVENCAVEAKVMPEKGKKVKHLEEDCQMMNNHADNATTVTMKEATAEMSDQKNDDNNDDDSSEDSIHNCNGWSNVETNRLKEQF
jgi:hypothetical protein